MPSWKALLLPLAVLLPLLAYAAGVVADGPDGPTRPEPVILDDRPAVDTSVGEPPRPREGRPGARPPRGGEDERDEDDGAASERGDPDEGDDPDESVRVVTPSPTELDDDEDDEDDDDDEPAGDADED